MKRSLPILLLSGIMLAAVLWGSPAFADVCNRIVAFVNDEVITLFELNKKVREVTGVDPADLEHRDPDEYRQTCRKVLDLIIDDRLTLQKVREFNIKVADKEVDAAIEEVKKTNNFTQDDLLISLKRQGLTYESYRRSIGNDIEKARLVNYEVKSKIIVREELLKAYYDEHLEEFTTKKKVHLATIFLRQKDPSNKSESRLLERTMREILDRLERGESFAELAARFSEGPGAEEGGDLGFFLPTQLDPAITALVESMSPGQVSGPIVRPSGVQIITLLGIREKKVKPLEEVKGAILEILYKHEIDKRYQAWIKELRETAYTKIVF